MKFTIKIALVISLFCSVTFAEGEMTSGGKTCTSNCLAGNSTTTTVSNDNNEKNSQDYVVTFVKDFLMKIFG